MGEDDRCRKSFDQWKNANVGKKNVRKEKSSDITRRVDHCGANARHSGPRSHGARIKGWKRAGWAKDQRIAGRSNGQLLRPQQSNSTKLYSKYGTQRIQSPPRGTYIAMHDRLIWDCITLITALMPPACLHTIWSHSQPMTTTPLTKTFLSDEMLFQVWIATKQLRRLVTNDQATLGSRYGTKRTYQAGISNGNQPPVGKNTSPCF